MTNLIGEFLRKCKDCVIDESIAEINGREAIKVNKWIATEVEKEMC